MNKLAMFKMSKSVGLFFLLLGIALLNNISIPHGKAALKSNVDVFARQLSTLSEIVNHYCPKTELKGSNNKNSAEQKCISAIYSELNDLKIIKRWVNMTVLFKDDISIDLRRYNWLFMHLYNNMQKQLSNKLTSLATKYGFPKKDKEKLWKECKEEIKKEFKEVNDYYKSICKDYENTLIIPGFLFNKKLDKYIKLWKEVAYRNEKKWSDTFEMKISKGKP
ncbi:RAD protein [Plasmodium cynomolgi strain B]|uniref:RAD protein n=1 Tax=Plasmodium cynomolgi (strain B) TaxID=1120755 RepID=K6V0P6_PLACD|nr:RAD protein [Plasmodium cynomolgi strain B]GAB69909.1 RAD protein [Plasmodium cynomolgi strain B]